MTERLLDVGDASLGGPKRQRGPIQGGKRPTNFSLVGSLSSLASPSGSVAAGGQPLLGTHYRPGLRRADLS
jgi:hypothetical protein